MLFCYSIENISSQMTFDQLETKGLLVDGFIQTVPSIEQKKLNLMEMKYSQNSSIRKAGLENNVFMDLLLLYCSSLR